MTYCGLGVGFIYDILRFTRWTMNASRALTALLDLLFCALALAAVLFFFIISGEKGLRVYVVLGLCCGVLLYVVGISPFASRAAAYLLDLSRKKAKKTGNKARN